MLDIHYCPRVSRIVPDNIPNVSNENENEDFIGIKFKIKKIKLN